MIFDDKKINSILLENNSNYNISISIASAITADARIHMSQFKHLDLLYSDTDSIYIKGKLDNKYIGTELGKMKLEYILFEAIFLGPTVYGGIINNKTQHIEIIKIKGFKYNVSFDLLKSLLIKDNKLELKQDK